MQLYCHKMRKGETHLQEKCVAEATRRCRCCAGSGCALSAPATPGCTTSTTTTSSTSVSAGGGVQLFIVLLERLIRGRPHLFRWPPLRSPVPAERERFICEDDTEVPSGGSGFLRQKSGSFLVGSVWILEEEDGVRRKASRIRAWLNTKRWGFFVFFFFTNLRVFSLFCALNVFFLLHSSLRTLLLQSSLVIFLICRALGVQLNLCDCKLNISQPYLCIGCLLIICSSDLAF